MDIAQVFVPLPSCQICLILSSPSRHQIPEDHSNPQHAPSQAGAPIGVPADFRGKRTQQTHRQSPYLFMYWSIYSIRMYLYLHIYIYVSVCLYIHIYIYFYPWRRIKRLSAHGHFMLSLQWNTDQLLSVDVLVFLCRVWWHDMSHPHTDISMLTCMHCTVL